MIATIGIRDSGTAVATAASTLPTAPWPRFSMLPNHSIAFVKRSAPASRIAKLAGRRMAELTDARVLPVAGGSSYRVDRRGDAIAARLPGTRSSTRGWMAKAADRAHTVLQDPGHALHLLRMMLLIRRFEERAEEQYTRARIG